MTAAPDVVFVDGLDYFTSAVRSLAESDWRLPSPCQGWRALDVVGHVGSAVQFGTILLNGGQPTWSPIDAPGGAVTGEPGEWWEALVGPARHAVAEVDLSQVVDSPMGRRTVADGLSFPALDLFVHAWDLARCVGRDLQIPSTVIDFAHHILDPLPNAVLRRETVFASAVHPPRDATPTQEFIAWTGRDSWWSPASAGETPQRSVPSTSSLDEATW